MQAGINFSSLQAFEFSRTLATTHLSVNQKNPKEEITNTQANSVPQSNIDKDGNGQTSEILSSNTLSSGNLNDFQKVIVNKALEKVSQIKEEMLKTWEEIFGLKPSNSSNSSQNMSLSIESLLNATLEQKALGSGINISQGFSQSLQVSIQGTIVASDGTKRQLDLSIGISQSFMQNLQISGVGNNNTQTSNKKVIDPLVIDYEGSGTELSDTKMRFDLDSDGKPDQIATLKKGSGFLALDKNGDGKINNGNELFGTKSGDGFKDLSVYDTNNDGKIDKEDPIYDKLRIWTPDGNGEGQLVGLGEKGIGVIYLNAKESQEMMRGENGDLLGIKQKTADFLFENGNNGKIHHIDLVSEKIKDEALRNQAQNDSILNTLQNINGRKTYQNLGATISNLQVSITSQSSQSALFEVLGNGITGLFERVPLANATKLEVNISLSMSSLQSGKNGVSFELSQMWAKLESNFGKIQSNQNDSQQTTGNLVESLLNHFETSYKNINRLLFDPSTQKDSANTFDLNALNMLRITRLLGA